MFKTGDKVRCIVGYKEGFYDLEKGKIYTVCRVAESYQTVRLKDTRGPYWSINRFEPVSKLTNAERIEEREKCLK